MVGGNDAAFPIYSEYRGLFMAQQSTLPMEPAGLRQQQQELAESVLLLVHELRTPVAASKALAASLRYVNKHDSQVNEVLGRIETRMDQLLALVNDILILAEAKAGDPRGEECTVDLVEETAAICEPQLEQAADKGLAMTLDLPGDPVHGRLAPRAYHLILSNLLSNAVKYTPAGSVHVRLWQEGAWVYVQVTDTGIGIPASEVPKLCQEFYRATNARRSRLPGSGLGLAGAEMMLRRYGGALTVRSVEGEGSSFTARMPICVAEESGHQEYPEQKANKGRAACVYQ
jgi:two-component system phosphate regulon sensor histidine kinase PhoR